MKKTVKVLLMGPSAAGKTALCRRLKFRRFEKEYIPTIGVELYDTEHEVNNEQYRFVLCDTDSEMGYDLLNKEFARGTNIVLLVADATRPETVEDMLALKESIATSSRNVAVIVATSKSDDNAVKAQWTQQVQTMHPEVGFFSAKTGSGVSSVLVQVAQAAQALPIRHSKMPSD